MDELLRTSLLWRLFAALAALYHRTFLPRMFAAIHRAFAESLPGRALRRLLGGQPAVECSAYRRLMDRGNAWLCGIGARVVPVLEDSLAYRIYRRVMAALRSSLLLGWLFAGGMTGCSCSRPMRSWTICCATCCSWRPLPPSGMSC